MEKHNFPTFKIPAVLSSTIVFYHRKIFCYIWLKTLAFCVIILLLIYLQREEDRVTMKFYYSFESAPLKFHKAFYKVLCPIFIGIRAILFLSTIIHLTNPDSYYDSGTLVLSLLFSGVEIVFLSLITYGFANKKEYAWYMVYAFLVETVLSGIINATQSANIASAVSETIGAFIIPILIGIYYYKRKPLFVTSEVNEEAKINNPNVTESQATLEINASQTITPNTSTNVQATICFCRKCGNKLINDSFFCNKCGAKTTWN